MVMRRLRDSWNRAIGGRRGSWDSQLVDAVFLFTRKQRLPFGLYLTDDEVRTMR